MRGPHMESVGFSERRFRGFHGWKKFFVSHEMPNCFPPASFDSQDAQQSKTAFQLKQQDHRQAQETET